MPSVMESGIHLTNQLVAHFQDEGFLALPPIVSNEEIAELREIIIGLFAKKAGHEQGAYFNFAGAEEDKDAPNIPQIIAPQNFAARLRKSAFRKNAGLIARQILGPKAVFHIDHTLVKLPHDGASTPWHQDEAFKDPRFDYSEISFWMPLQPVTELNGCMAFIPGTHRRGVLPHRTPGDDPRVHALECCDVDLATAVPCPLEAGACTLHTGRTLHAAGPNRSDDPRYAYVLIFHLPPEPATTPKSFPWLKGKETARMKRTRQWLDRGGKYIALWRVLRNKELRDYKRSFLKLRKRVFDF